MNLNLEKLVVPDTPRKSERVDIGHVRKLSRISASKSQASADSDCDVQAVNEDSDKNSNYTNTSIKRFGDSSEDTSSQNSGFSYLNSATVLKNQITAKYKIANQSKAPQQSLKPPL